MHFEYVEYNAIVSDECLLADMIRVFKENNLDYLTINDYSQYGKYDNSTIIRRFGSWNNALLKAEIPIKQHFWTEEELFENIECVWIKKGTQPRKRDMDDKTLSFISSGAYLRKFGKWSNALKAFVDYINNEEVEFINLDKPVQNMIENHKTKRDINLRLRYKVIKRDNFTCCVCGASPAKDPSIELQVDHIVPWSKGGETLIDNLQTLCSNCNLGKSNL